MNWPTHFHLIPPNFKFQFKYHELPKLVLVTNKLLFKLIKKLSFSMLFLRILSFFVDGCGFYEIEFIINNI